MLVNALVWDLGKIENNQQRKDRISLNRESLLVAELFVKRMASLVAI